MQIPSDGSAESKFLWGRYVIRALSRAGYDDLVALFGPKNVAVRAAGRVLEDEAVPVQEAICDRDQVDHLLDDEARAVRLQLLARGMRADQEPYLSIIPKTLQEYTEARLIDEALVYGKLCTRLVDNLPPGDVLVTETVPRIQGSLALWDGAVKAIEQAKQVEDAAAGRLRSAERAWEQGVLEVYGLLLARVGKANVERFFPKVKKKTKKKTETASESQAESAGAGVGEGAAAADGAPTGNGAATGDATSSSNGAATGDAGSSSNGAATGDAGSSSNGVAASNDGVGTDATA